MSLRSHSHALGRVTMALLMVLTVVAGPMAGSAAADPTVSTDCGVDDAIRGVWDSVADPEIDCGYYEDTQEDMTELDAYSSALALRASNKAYFTQRMNMNEDVRGLMWMKGKAAAIDAINNGSTEAETQAAFTKAVRDYSTRVIKNDLNQTAQVAIQLTYIANQTGATTTSAGSLDRIYSGLATNTYRLPNGENYTFPSFVSEGRISNPIVYSAHDNLTGEYHLGDTWSPGMVVLTNESYEYTSTQEGYGTEPGIIEHPNNTQNVATSWGYKSAFGGLLDAQYAVVTQGETWAAQAHAQVESGEISASELWDPVTLAQEGSTSYESTGFYSFLSAEAAALGMAGSANASHVVHTQVVEREFRDGASYNTTYNVSIEGTMYINGADMNLQTGTRYTPSMTAGTEYITVANITNRDTGGGFNASARLIKLTNNYTIVNATNVVTGDPVEVTSSQEKDYTTTNITRFKEQIQDIKAERNRLERQRASLLAEVGNGSDQQAQQGGLWADLQDWWTQLTRGIAVGVIVLALAGLYLLPQLLDMLGGPG